MGRTGFYKWILVLSITGLASCAPGRINAPPSEESKPPAQGVVSIEKAQILLLESFPVQVQLQLEGYKPTPCHTLQWGVSEPDSQGRIDVEVRAGIESELLCIQVVERFEVRIPLGDYTEGAFSVWVNGEQVGAFEL
jgi:hypothetical protein